MRTIVIITAIFFTVNLYGQKKIKRNLEIDIGTNFTIPHIEKYSFSGGNHPFTREYKSSLGYNLELLLNRTFNKHLFISYGLNYFQNRYNYNQRTFQNEIAGSILTEGYYARQSYLNISAVIKFKFYTRLPINIGIGPYFGFLLNHKESDNRNTVLYNPFVLGFYPQADIEFLKKTHFVLSFYFKSNIDFGGNWYSDDYIMTSENKRIIKINLKSGIGLKF